MKRLLATLLSGIALCGGSSQALTAGCPGVIEPFSSGCSSSVGLPLKLTGTGCPGPGQPLALDLQGSAPNAPALLLASGLTSISPGCLLFPPTIVVPIGSTTPGGSLTLAGVLPPVASFKIQIQIAVVDNVPFGAATSNGLLLVAF